MVENRVREEKRRVFKGKRERVYEEKIVEKAETKVFLRFPYRNRN